MNHIVRGNAVVFEATIQEYPPFGALANDDPANSVKITVIDPDGTKVVDNQSMTRKDTGDYYYKLQTTSSFVLGIYTGQVSIDDTAYDGIFITNKLFQLVELDD